MKNIENHIESFLNKQNSDITVKTYKGVIKRFVDWYEENNIKQLEDGKWVQNFINFLCKSGLTNRTVNHNLIVVSQFYKHITGKKLEIYRLKEQPREVSFLTTEEIEKLLAVLTGKYKTVVKFMLDSGLRVSETVRFLTDENRNWVVKGKGGYQRRVFCSDEVMVELEGIRGLPLTVKGIQRALKVAAMKSGIAKRVHPHLLRHTFATLLMNNGVNIQDIQGFLGHKHLSTTQIYTHVTEDRLREVYNKYHLKTA